MRTPSHAICLAICSITVLGALVACGGHSSPSAGAQAFIGRIAATDGAQARKRTLAVAETVTPDTVLDWAEYKYAALFAKGPTSFALVHEGKNYTVRAYPHAGGTRYLGITAEGEIYGLGDFTNDQLLRLGVVADYAAQVTADRCSVDPGSCATEVVGLPAELLSRPSHPDCAALRSGPYRWLNPTESDPAWNTFVAQMDAPTLRTTFPDGSTSTSVSTGNCTFSAEGGQTRMVVSAAGVIVSTSYNAQLRQQAVAIAFPEQPLQPGDLAGVGNWSSYRVTDSGPSGKRWRNRYGVAEFGSDGQQLRMDLCDGPSTCVPSTDALGAVSVNAAGGLNLVTPNSPNTLRVFGYRPASGDLTWFGITADNLIVAARQRTLPLPAVGDASNAWNLDINSFGSAAATLSESIGSVTAVDATARTYSRTLASGRVDVWQLDVPRPGLRHRVGSPTSSELLALPLPGLGMMTYGAVTIDSTPNAGLFGFSVTK